MLACKVGHTASGEEAGTLWPLSSTNLILSSKSLKKNPTKLSQFEIGKPRHSLE